MFTALRVVLGANHGLAILADGGIVAWGVNDCGRLGDGTTTRRYSPVLVTFAN